MLITVVDIEGTKGSGVVEYGLVVLEGGGVVEVKTEICRPTGVITGEESAAHGIYWEDTVGQSFFSERWELFMGLRRRGLLGAHNAAYEDGFFSGIWPYIARVPGFLGEGGEVTTWKPWIDTCQMGRRLYPGLKSYKLGWLVGVFKLQEELDEMAEEYCPEGRRRYHCALYDALGASLLLRRYMREFELTREQMIVYSAGSKKEYADRNQLLF